MAPTCTVHSPTRSKCSSHPSVVTRLCSFTWWLIVHSLVWLKNVHSLCGLVSIILCGMTCMSVHFMLGDHSLVWLDNVRSHCGLVSIILCGIHLVVDCPQSCVATQYPFTVQLGIHSLVWLDCPFTWWVAVHLVVDTQSCVAKQCPFTLWLGVHSLVWLNYMYVRSLGGWLSSLVWLDHVRSLCGWVSIVLCGQAMSIHFVARCPQSCVATPCPFTLWLGVHSLVWLGHVHSLCG